MVAPLVLASQSPRRRSLLAGLGFALEVCPAHAETTTSGTPFAARYVKQAWRIAYGVTRRTPASVMSR